MVEICSSKVVVCLIFGGRSGSTMIYGNDGESLGKIQPSESFGVLTVEIEGKAMRGREKKRKQTGVVNTRGPR